MGEKMFGDHFLWSVLLPHDFLIIFSQVIFNKTQTQALSKHFQN